MALVAEPRAIGEVFNLGNNQEITIRELAELVKTMADSDSDIVAIPYEEAYESGFEDMPRRVPDLTKARALIDYEPRVQLPEILSKVIEHHRTQRKGRR
jgi:UDP-glucose 4-epimerase